MDCTHAGAKGLALKKSWCQHSPWTSVFGLVRASLRHVHKFAFALDVGMRGPTATPILDGNYTGTLEQLQCDVTEWWGLPVVSIANSVPPTIRLH